MTVGVTWFIEHMFKIYFLLTGCSIACPRRKMLHVCAWNHLLDKMHAGLVCMALLHLCARILWAGVWISLNLVNFGWKHRQTGLSCWKWGTELVRIHIHFLFSMGVEIKGTGIYGGSTSAWITPSRCSHRSAWQQKSVSYQEWLVWLRQCGVTALQPTLTSLL